MSFEPREYLRHMGVETEYLLAHSAGISREQFLADDTLKRAFVRSIEVIGEATKKLPQDFRSAHAAVDWRAIAGMRDRLTHGYLTVDYELVWDVIRTRMPVLDAQIAAILSNR